MSASTNGPWWETSGTTIGSNENRLSYSYGGPEDARAIVCCNGLGVSTFFWQYVGRAFTKENKVVIWDYPGHGASGRPHDLTSLSMKSLADDLRFILDAIEVDRAVLLGHSLGCQTIFEFYRQYPERVLGLVPMLGAYGKPAETFLDPRVGMKIYQTVYKYGTRYPNVLNLASQSALRSPLAWPFAKATGLVHPNLCPREDMAPYLDHLSQLDFQVFLELARAAQEHDAEDMLEDIKVPTLVVAGEKDLFTPRALSEKMAEKIPNARLLEIPDGSHAALIEQPDLINRELQTFLSNDVNRFEESRVR
ncbi:MAG: alpha/beta hydrolase [Myxococcota bacterium]|nr:alpha/beta hydrolase [Myxococcota bacterium]